MDIEKSIFTWQSVSFPQREERSSCWLSGKTSRGWASFTLLEDHKFDNCRTSFFSISYPNLYLAGFASFFSLRHRPEISYLLPVKNDLFIPIRQSYFEFAKTFLWATAIIRGWERMTLYITIVTIITWSWAHLYYKLNNFQSPVVSVVEVQFFGRNYLWISLPFSTWNLLTVYVRKLCSSLMSWKIMNFEPN